MKKYILSFMFVLVFMFSFGNVSLASELSSSEIQAISDILRVMKVSDSDIIRITDILNNNIISTGQALEPQYQYPVEYNTNTGDILPQLTGCESNHKYNIRTGNACSEYKEPKKPTEGQIQQQKRIEIQKEREKKSNCGGNCAVSA